MNQTRSRTGRSLSRFYEDIRKARAVAGDDRNYEGWETLHFGECHAGRLQSDHRRFSGVMRPRCELPNRLDEGSSYLSSFFRKCPRHESNLHLEFRKPSFYPLNYGGAGGQE